MLKNIRFAKDYLKYPQLKIGGQKKLLHIVEPYDWAEIFGDQNFKRSYHVTLLRPDNYFPTNLRHSVTVKKF